MGVVDGSVVAGVPLEELEGVPLVGVTPYTCKGRNLHRHTHHESAEELEEVVVLLEVHPWMLWLEAAVVEEVAQHEVAMGARASMLKVSLGSGLEYPRLLGCCHRHSALEHATSTHPCAWHQTQYRCRNHPHNQSHLRDQPSSRCYPWCVGEMEELRVVEAEVDGLFRLERKAGFPSELAVSHACPESLQTFRPMLGKSFVLMVAKLTVFWVKSPNGLGVRPKFRLQIQILG